MPSAEIPAIQRRSAILAVNTRRRGPLSMAAVDSSLLFSPTFFPYPFSAAFLPAILAFDCHPPMCLLTKPAAQRWCQRTGAQDD